uniref:Uncharacterized protein n=1 Tax=Oryza meridionalis TaxID=40149 RepID=A0A0E0CNV9_9ORYZ
MSGCHVSPLSLFPLFSHPLSLAFLLCKRQAAGGWGEFAGARWERRRLGGGDGCDLRPCGEEGQRDGRWPAERSWAWAAAAASPTRRTCSRRGRRGCSWKDWRTRGGPPAGTSASYQWVEREPVAMRAARGPPPGRRHADGYTLEHVPGTKIGGTIFDRSGRHHTAADFLRRAHPRRLTVFLRRRRWRRRGGRPSCSRVVVAVSRRPSPCPTEEKRCGERKRGGEWRGRRC